MRKSLVALTTVAALGLAACQGETTQTAEPAKVAAADMTEAQKQAYAMGASMGMFVHNRGEQHAEFGDALDTEVLMQGFKDGMANSVEFSAQEIQQLAQAGEQALRTKMQEKAQAAATDNLAAGEAYLAENAKREGVTTTESGLQYEVLVEGEGVSPKAEDTVEVHYKGTLLDGTVFDSSYDRGETAKFPLNRVIAGWTEGVQLMKEGAKYRFHIPANLAYGERATGKITPNSTLVFDVELIDVVETEAKAEEGAAEVN